MSESYRKQLWNTLSKAAPVCAGAQASAEGGIIQKWKNVLQQVPKVELFKNLNLDT